MLFDYNAVIMGAMASQITRLTTVYSTGYIGSDQGKHQSSASLALGIRPVTGEFPAQMASNAEKITIWWCHHANINMHIVEAQYIAIVWNGLNFLCVLICIGIGHNYNLHSWRRSDSSSIYKCLRCPGEIWGSAQTVLVFVMCLQNLYIKIWWPSSK